MPAAGSRRRVFIERRVAETVDAALEKPGTALDSAPLPVAGAQCKEVDGQAEEHGDGHVEEGNDRCRDVAKDLTPHLGVGVIGQGSPATRRSERPTTVRGTSAIKRALKLRLRDLVPANRSSQSGSSDSNGRAPADLNTQGSLRPRPRNWTVDPIALAGRWHPRMFGGCSLAR